MRTFFSRRSRENRCPRQTHTRLHIEKLEPRLALSAAASLESGSPSNVPIPDDVTEVVHPVGNVRELILSVDDPLNHETQSNEFTGVGRLDLVTIFSPNGICTGTLLPTGRHVLTAVHCFAGYIEGDVTFSHPGGVETITIKERDQFPGGTTRAGGDVAIVTLDDRASENIERYDIYRDTDEIGKEFVKVGYGLIGTGDTGIIPGSGGTKHHGRNRYDVSGDYLDDFVPIVSGPGGGVQVTVAPDSQLVFDFDNGLVANDASGYWFGTVPNGPQDPAAFDLGLGDDEVITNVGDSGGPGFIDGKVAGVTSYGLFEYGTPPDLSSAVGTFGELAVDARVSTYASWIDSIVGDMAGPQVEGVTLARSGVPSADYSVPVGSGEQIRTVDIQLVDTVRIQFNEPMEVSALDAGDLELIDFDTGLPLAGVTATGVGYDAATDTATWTLSGPLPNGRIDL